MTPHFDPRRDVELRRALEAIERSAPQAVGLDAGRFAAAPTRRTSPVKVIAVAVAVVAAAALPMLFLGRDVADEAPSIGGPGGETNPGQSEEQTPGSRDDALGPIVGTNLEGLPIDHVIPVADGFLGLSWAWGDEPLLVGWSPDGREWEPRGVVTDGPSSPVQAFEIDGTVLLVGWRDTAPLDPDADASERLPRSVHAWQSADGGFTWTETVTEIGEPGTGALAAAATPLGFVLVGVVPGVLSGPDVYESHAAVWMSDDGTDWRPVWSSDDPEGVSSGAWSVVWWQGEIMVFGGRGEPRMGEDLGAPDRPEPWEPVVWTSSDGLTWSEPRQTTEVGGLVAGAVATSWGLTALIDQSLAGQVPLKHAVAVGTSPNGVTWTIEPIGGANFDAVGPVVVDGRGVVAVGMPPAEANQSPGWTQLEMWAQTDAGRWVRVEVPGLPSEPAHITHIVGGTDRILILGWVAAPWPEPGEYFAISIPLTEWETLIARAG